MPLGNNRDYKTADRRARRGLAKHAARMNELVSQGMDREAASSQAFAEMQRVREERAANRRARDTSPSPSVQHVPLEQL
jgi:hypothetical protein